MVLSFGSKKDRLAIDITCLSQKMLPKFYQTHLRSTLNANQYILLNLLVELLQEQRQVRLERLAANLPVPIKFESRRRLLQRFLICPQLAISTIWFSIVNYLLESYFSHTKKLFIVVDRTQWRELNLLMISLVWNSRAIPLSWQFLSHKDERFWRNNSSQNSLTIVASLSNKSYLKACYHNF